MLIMVVLKRLSIISKLVTIINLKYFQQSISSTEYQIEEEQHLEILESKQFIWSINRITDLFQSPTLLGPVTGLINKIQGAIENLENTEKILYLAEQLKVGLSPLFFFYLLQWEPVKYNEKCFLFNLKNFFLPKIFKLLSRPFGHIEKTACLER